MGWDDDDFGTNGAVPNKEAELDEFFSGGGGPKGISWKDARVNDEIRGIIFDVDLRDKLDKKTNKPELNAYGKPKRVLILSLITDLRDSEIEDDDGARRAFLQGNAQWEFRQFLRQNGFTKPLKGGYFRQVLKGTKPTEHYNDQNLFLCQYKDPDAESLAILAKFLGQGNQNVQPAPVGGGGFDDTQPARATTMDMMRRGGNGGEKAPF